MFTYYEFNRIVLETEQIIKEYKYKYDELLLKSQQSYEEESIIIEGSSRTIHNLKENIRPDFMMLNSAMNFFDFSPFWRKKEKRKYRIVLSTDDKIKYILVGKDYIEFHIYSTDKIVLVDYSKDENGINYNLESIGIGFFNNSIIKTFLVAEINSYSNTYLTYDLKCEQYEYNYNLISTIIAYEYSSINEITTDINNPNSLGSKVCSNNRIMANPHIYIDDFKYGDNGKLSKIIRSDFSNPKIGNCTISIKNQR